MARYKVSVNGLLIIQTCHVYDWFELISARIINVSSVAGLYGYPGLSTYCATKHALEAVSAVLRQELAKFNVSVITVQPGDFSKATHLLDNHHRLVKLIFRRPFVVFSNFFFAETWMKCGQKWVKTAEKNIEIISLLTTMVLLKQVSLARGSNQWQFYQEMS